MILLAMKDGVQGTPNELTPIFAKALTSLLFSWLNKYNNSLFAILKNELNCVYVDKMIFLSKSLLSKLSLERSYHE